MDKPALQRTGYIPGLDGIRALAIAFVLFAHSVIYDEFNQLGMIGLGAGRAGVAVFFVLSGYLITSLLLREEDRTGGISLRLFYLRRALRLFPALWLYLIVLAVIQLAGFLPHHPWYSFVSSLLYVRNLVGQGHETGHLWSLSIEEQFYFLWPLMVVCCPGRNRIRLCVALAGILAVTVWRIHAARTGMVLSGVLYMRSDFRFDSPLFGCALALIEQVAPRAVGWLNSTGLRSAILSILGASGLVVWVSFRLREAVYPGTDSTVVCLLGVILILSQVGVQSRGSRWLTWPPLVMVGKISYGVYLWQQLFMGPRAAGFEHIRVFPFGIIAAFAVAVVSYRFLELPLIRLKDRMFHKTVRAPEQRTPSQAERPGK